MKTYKRINCKQCGASYMSRVLQPLRCSRCQRPLTVTIAKEKKR